MTTLREKFYNFKARQRQCKTAVEFTFDQWLDIWEESGHLQDRGFGPGKWALTRIDKTLPYSVDNVHCVPFEVLRQEIGQHSKQRWARIHALQQQQVQNGTQP